MDEKIITLQNLNVNNEEMKKYIENSISTSSIKISEDNTFEPLEENMEV